MGKVIERMIQSRLQVLAGRALPESHVVSGGGSSVLI